MSEKAEIERKENIIKSFRTILESKQYAWVSQDLKNTYASNSLFDLRNDLNAYNEKVEKTNVSKKVLGIIENCLKETLFKIKEHDIEFDGAFCEVDITLESRNDGDSSDLSELYTRIQRHLADFNYLLYFENARQIKLRITARVTDILKLGN